MQVDNKNKFEAAIFTFTFDQGTFPALFLLLLPVASLPPSQTNTSPDLTFVAKDYPTVQLKQSELVSSNNRTAGLCFSPLACYSPSNFSVALYGMFHTQTNTMSSFSLFLIDMLTLECPSETIGSSPTYFSDYDNSSPPSYLILFPGGSKEPLLRFFSPILYPSLSSIVVFSAS